MSSMPAAHPNFCTACGGALTGPVQRCPRCGGAISAQGVTHRGNRSIILIVLAVAIIPVIAIIGILAAIAIPNFIRYQLRAKASELPVVLRSLVAAEQAALARDGAYLPVPALPAAPLGPQKRPLSPEELQVAAKLGWTVAPQLYGRYAVRVAEVEGGGNSASLCAESDLDGDGQPQVWVAFFPTEGGEAVAAPCTVPVEYEARFGAGMATQVSDRSVF